MTWKCLNPQGVQSNGAVVAAGETATETAGEMAEAVEAAALQDQEAAKGSKSPNDSSEKKPDGNENTDTDTGTSHQTVQVN